MFSFIVENKGKNDVSVTGTYMNIVHDACEMTGATVENVVMGQKPKDKESIVVSDTINASIKYFMKGYRNQVVWMQGVTPEESYMRNHSRARLWVWNCLERYVLKHSKMLLMVSDEMLRHYECKYNLSLKGKTIIMPCFNELDVIESAFSQIKYDSNTFAYVGSLHKWQCFEDTLRLYSIIESRAARKTKLFVYTFETEKAQEVISRYDIENYEVEYVDKEELSARLKHIKYGFVLRQNCTVNNVATPTKFSNYLSNGIIPIYSSALKSFAEYDKNNAVGIICDIDRLDEGVSAIEQSMNKSLDSLEVKDKCKRIFSDYYNAAGYKSSICNKLKEMNLC